jgi:crotonobetainyl-CoA:carnitine CoA-transferase CaiB-like acyl-CoA transferase
MTSTGPTIERDVPSGGALQGVRIIDLTQMLAGPYATSILADMGADVIKIEQPKVGDRFRPRDGNARLGAFLAHNRNKQSVTINLRTPKGIEVVRRLIDGADACVSNFRPGFLDRIGLGYDDLRHSNPRLIYVVGTSFGQRGPLAEGPNPRPGVDIVGQAMSGLMAACRDEEGYPRGAGAPITDQAQGILIALGLVLALNARYRTGRGQMVESSLLGATLALQSGQIGLTTVSGKLPIPGRRTHFLDPIYGSYRTSDGYLVIGSVVGEEQWRAFCGALGCAELADDARFANVAARMARCEELMDLLDRVLGTRTTADWLERFVAADVIAAPVHDYLEMTGDPQVRANDYVVDLEVPGEGVAAFVGIPIKLSDTPGTIRRRSPELGENTREVLSAAGYTDSEIDQLSLDEVI